MLNTILKVLSAKSDIIRETTTYQNLCHTPHSDTQYRAALQRLDNYFNNFTDNEIMVIQSIMYIGRDYITGMLPSYSSNVELMNIYFKELRFKLNGKIDKSIEIDQMDSKGMLIADYFNAGFQIIK